MILHIHEQTVKKNSLSECAFVLTDSPQEFQQLEHTHKDAPNLMAQTKTKIQTPEDKFSTKDGITVEIRAIGPDLARELLNHNAMNRRINASRADQYSRQMEEGDWQFNGETIKIDKRGQLADGQHRLKAIIQSGTEQRCLVVNGLHPSARHTIDTGKSRSPADVLHMHGFTYAYKMAAAARIIYYYENHTLDQYHTRENRPTNQEILDLAIDIETGLIQSLKKTHQSFTSKTIRPSIAAAMHYIFYQKAPQRADNFFESFRTGANLESGSPVLLLRNTLQELALRDRRPGYKGTIAYVIMAWNAYVRGESLDGFDWTRNDAMPEITEAPEAD